MERRLTFHIITSPVFWVGAPLVITEILRRGHYISVLDEKLLPAPKKLLECDVLIDMSAITDEKFYRSLEKEHKRKIQSGEKAPLMVDSPGAIIDSFDKNRTHKHFPDLIPESYTLTGRNNQEVFEYFKNDEYVVIKPIIGWWGRGIERIAPMEARGIYRKTKGMIVQKYIPFEKGIGRVVTLNHENDFEIVSSYLRVPINSWRTGIDIKYDCVQEPITEGLGKFAQFVSKKSGLYLNGIDYIHSNGKYILLEVNAVPAMKESYDAFGIDIPKKLLTHLERNLITE